MYVMNIILKESIVRFIANVVCVHKLCHEKLGGLINYVVDTF